jgi:hypothetical protein
MDKLNREKPRNAAVRRGSSATYVAPDSACHAGGRGFKSRRSRTEARHGLVEPLLALADQFMFPRFHRLEAQDSFRELR